jgi:uncharacterized protein YndB with AHSA1/START domain
MMERMAPRRVLSPDIMYQQEQPMTATVDTKPSDTKSSDTKSSLDRELVITRVFDAPRSLVFKAWTDPKHMAQWWGPKGFTNPLCEIDARPGGAIRIVMRAPEDVPAHARGDHPMGGMFLEVIAPERLVFTATVDDADGDRLFEVLNTATFVEHGGKTTLTLHVQARVVKATAQVAMMLGGMEEGWNQSLDRLGALVVRMR